MFRNAPEPRTRNRYIYTDVLRPCVLRPPIWIYVMRYQKTIAILKLLQCHHFSHFCNDLMNSEKSVSDSFMISTDNGKRMLFYMIHVSMGSEISLRSLPQKYRILMLRRCCMFVLSILRYYVNQHYKKKSKFGPNRKGSLLGPTI